MAQKHPKVGDLILNPDYNSADDDSVYARPILSTRKGQAVIRHFANEDRSEFIPFSKLQREDGHWNICEEHAVSGAEKLPFLGVFNWHGQNVRIETRALSVAQARNFMMHRLAQEIGQPASHVTFYYKERPQGYEITLLHGDEAPCIR